MQYFIGIDPGLTGGISILKREGGGDVLPCRFIQMPVMTFEEGKGKAKKTKNSIDIFSLRSVFEKFLSEEGTTPDSVTVVVEKPMPAIGAGGKNLRGSLGTSSLFRSFGQIEGLLIGLRFNYVAVAPQTWKALLLKGTAKDKQAAYNLAIAFPTMPEVLANVKVMAKRSKADCQTGIADSFCMALYATKVF